MATTALGIMQTEDGTGTSPLTLRRIIKARWENKGIVTGLKVTGRSDLRYDVAAGCAVVSRSDADGYAEAYWEGGQTPAVSAGDPSNPRVDTVWIKANDKQQGDADNRVHAGVTQGQPSANPVAPSAPSGCLVLAQMRMPSSATSTNSAQKEADGDVAIPYGASLGLLAEYIDNRTIQGTANPGEYYVENNVSFRLPTDRVVELEFSACAMARDGDWCDWYQSFVVDGAEVPTSGGQIHLVEGSIQSFQNRFVMKMVAGSHTVAVKTGVQAPGGVRPYFVYGTYQISSGITGTYSGRALRVWDRGIAS